MAYFARAGHAVYVPIGHSPDADLVIDGRDGLRRVQVKTTSCYVRERWEVTLCTRGGNQSWSGVSRLFSASRCDILFVLAADGRQWCIPAAEVEGGHGILLGGPKYAPYEVVRGTPFDVHAARSTGTDEPVVRATPAL